jgi:hypothetical protein
MTTNIYIDKKLAILATLTIVLTSWTMGLSCGAVARRTRDEGVLCAHPAIPTCYDSLPQSR